MVTSFQVTFDCADPDRLAHFWAAALGYRIPEPPAGHATWQEWLRSRGVPQEDWNSASAIEDPEGARPRIYFQRVPEPKTSKNRMHLDLTVGGGSGVPVDERRARVDAEVARLRALGASDHRGAIDQDGEYWVRLNDPEGNEFCLQ